MKKLLKIFLIIIAIVAVVLMVITGIAAGQAALAGQALFGAASATTGFTGATSALLGALGFTSLTSVFVVLGGIALTAYLIYDLAFSGGKTVTAITTNAIKAAKKTFHAATDGLKKSAKRLNRPFTGWWWVKIALVIGILGYGVALFRRSTND